MAFKCNSGSYSTKDIKSGLHSTVTREKYNQRLQYRALDEPTCRCRSFSAKSHLGTVQETLVNITRSQIKPKYPIHSNRKQL